ncbi:cytochrome P450 [Mycena sanguinolenta]|nr:cytochrome P450 [Mycena sanguinolenta]
MHSLALLVLAAIALRVFHNVVRAWHRRRLPFPPGPPPYALIGNFLDLPKELPWLTYTKWGMQYGQHIVVVNSVKTAVELFEKRMGWDFNLALLPRGDKWRAYRRMFHQHFRPDVSRHYRPIQIKKIHLVAAATIMATLYEYDVQPTNDHFVALSESAVTKLSESVFPGAVAVDTFPILRYLPSWMPGAGFQRFAAESRQLTKEMQEVPVNFVKQNMRDGMDSTSVVAKLIAAHRYDEVAIQAVAATAYSGGADTTVSSLASFCLAMALYPEIQEKAQTEIDTVIGAGRLPEFEDRPSLPFVEALYRETMRWRPITPLGLAHASAEHDLYNGYFIPKGTTVIANICFGRRKCPGRHHADATVWAGIVSVLSTFNIAKAKDATGKEIDIDPKYSDGLISHPEPFACSITPRSEMAKTLVEATAVSHDL